MKTTRPPDIFGIGNRQLGLSLCPSMVLPDGGVRCPHQSFEAKTYGYQVRKRSRLLGNRAGGGGGCSYRLCPQSPQFISYLVRLWGTSWNNSHRRQSWQSWQRGHRARASGSGRLSWQRGAASSRGCLLLGGNSRGSEHLLRPLANRCGKFGDA